LNGNILSATQILGALILLFAAVRATALNQPARFVGKVIAGSGRGDEIGAKTANLDVSLADGIYYGLYVCKAIVGDKNYDGLLYYGYNSLTEKNTLEIHLLNFDKDIYGQDLDVETVRYLRAPKKFDSVEKLKLQVLKDLETVG